MRLPDRFDFWCRVGNVLDRISERLHVAGHPKLAAWFFLRSAELGARALPDGWPVDDIEFSDAEIADRAATRDVEVRRMACLDGEA